MRWPTPEFPLDQWRSKLLKHGALKLTMEKQYEVNKAPDMCPCGEYHGLSCPRRKLVLWQ
jgi:hypothetical protein